MKTGILKQIPDFPGYYITKDGKVWSKPRKDLLGHLRKGKFLKPALSCGYFRVCLSKEGEQCGKYIHQLLLETFVGLCPSGMETRHLNGIRTDNRLENLCWGTRNENQRDSVKHGTHVNNSGEKNSKAKLTGQDVKLIRLLYESKKFNRYELADKFNISKSNICRIINKDIWRMQNGSSH